MLITLLSMNRNHADALHAICKTYGINATIEVDRDSQNYIDNENILYNAELDGNDFHIQVLKNSFILSPVHGNIVKDGITFDVHDIGQLIIE